MSTLPLQPVSAGFFAALDQGALTDLANGPFDTQVPQRTGFPFVWFVLSAENARGFGRGGLRRVDARVHAAVAASAAAGAAKELQEIQAVVVNLLEDETLTISGYQQAGEITYGMTTDPVAALLNDVACWESVSNFYFWVEP